MVTNFAPSRFMIMDLPRDHTKARALSMLLGDLRDQKVLVQVPAQEEGRRFYLHVFVVSKPSQKLRLINQSQRTEQVYQLQKCLMDSIYSGKSLLFQDCFMAPLDLSDTYLQIRIQPPHGVFCRWLSATEQSSLVCSTPVLVSQPHGF